MKRATWIAIVLCAACKPTPRPEPMPVVPVTSGAPDAAVADAAGESADETPREPAAPPPKLGPRTAGAAPCSAGDLGTKGNPLALQPVPEDCDGRWDAIDRIIGDARSARGGMRSSEGPIKPPKQHVIWSPNEGSLWAIEATSSKELDKLVSCPHGMKVDWTRDHVWIVTYETDDAGVSVGSVIDDGQISVIGLHTGGRDGCGGAAPKWEHAFTLALVPAGRAVALAECTSTAPARHCTGLEK